MVAVPFNSSAELEEIFFGAIELSPADRPAFLDRACKDNWVLSQRIAELVRAHDRAGPLLDPIDVLPPASAATQCEREYVDRFKLIRKIGEGGCGTVYLAEQTTPVRRRVAMKIIKRGMDSAEVVARFKAEQQALAMMGHPNIARVFDAGTTESGRPYFVMEYVAGTKVTTYCDEHHLSIPERLRLFVPICQAIQHAHCKGIVHRDIKPSNVLIALLDDDPSPKLIDFGIAKATQGRLTEQTLWTAFSEFMGTPVYMSPEQMHPDGIEIDGRSDIYSLGVLLYELVAGLPPFNPKVVTQAGVDDLRRQIRETEPQHLSARLTTLPEEERATIARCRRIDAPRLASLLQGELDWIVMRCLEKDRTRRYETASALADDIVRYLHHEPVAASPPSALYKLRKLIRRHKFGVMTTVLIAFTLAVGIVAGARQADRARRAEQLAAIRLNSEQAAREDAETARRLAEALLKELSRHERVLGAENKDVLATKSDLAALFRAEQRFEDAAVLLRETLVAQQRMLGPKKFATFRSARNLGAVYLAQQKFALAKALLVDFCYPNLVANAVDEMPANQRSAQLQDVVGLIVRLYSDWGRADDAREWNGRLDKLTQTAENPDFELLSPVPGLQGADEYPLSPVRPYRPDALPGGATPLQPDIPAEVPVRDASDHSQRNSQLPPTGGQTRFYEYNKNA